MIQAAEQMLVKAPITDVAVEAFGKAILLQFSRHDIMPLHLRVGCPLQDGLAGQLDAVVSEDNGGRAVNGH